MANYSVPPAFRRSFEALASLAAEEAELLFEEVEEAPLFESSQKLEALFAPYIDGQGGTGASLLVPALMSLKGQARRETARTLAVDVASAHDLDLSESARATLADRLGRLLAVPAISSTAAALELLTQHERNYQQARIVSDIRPVFGEDVDDSPIGAVIVEMMSVVYWGNSGSAETFSVALDETDLRQLQEVVERALAKTESLKRTLREQEIPYFELD